MLEELEHAYKFNLNFLQGTQWYANSTLCFLHLKLTFQHSGENVSVTHWWILWFPMTRSPCRPTVCCMFLPVLGPGRCWIWHGPTLLPVWQYCGSDWKQTSKETVKCCEMICVALCIIKCVALYIINCVAHYIIKCVALYAINFLSIYNFLSVHPSLSHTSSLHAL